MVDKIVTAYLFREGRLDLGRLEQISAAVGREQLVIDLSCRWRDGACWAVADRWQTFTQLCVTAEALRELAGHCAEFAWAAAMSALVPPASNAAQAPMADLV